MFILTKIIFVDAEEERIDERIFICAAKTKQGLLYEIMLSKRADKTEIEKSLVNIFDNKVSGRSAMLDIIEIPDERSVKDIMAVLIEKMGFDKHTLAITFTPNHTS